MTTKTSKPFLLDWIIVSYTQAWEKISNPNLLEQAQGW